jgi:hypothetical protein
MRKVIRRGKVGVMTRLEGTNNEKSNQEKLRRVESN